MKQLVYISLALFLLSCSSQEGESIVNQLDYSAPVGQTDIQDGINYNGNFIIIKKEEFEGNDFVIQRVKKEKQDISFQAELIPTELFLLNKGLRGADLEKAIFETKGEQMFYFEFEEKNKQDVLKKYHEEDMDEAVSYLSFDIQKDFYLVTEKGDSIQSSYVIYERNYHVAPYEKILVCFDRIDNIEDCKLVYIDQLFGKGESSFAFAPDEIIRKKINQPS